MPSRFKSVTTSRFARRLPGGRHDLLFKLVFGSDGSAARHFKVSRMTIWRWRHDKAPLPKRVLEALPQLVQARVAEAHLAQAELGYFLRETSKAASQALRVLRRIHTEIRNLVFLMRGRLSLSVCASATPAYAKNSMAAGEKVLRP
jgi:hypothetical protein